ncbi:hypothetical protein EDD66_101358 [Mobilisporobacter senegalensis]|uniref:Uncharacterized protein n=1 Tax=Mobilisporobacter senegalensis TaxID=1329262 RepID=A0A3N1XYS8_9FIRM|nr:hypothetical protein [Mobilisporobacter senegalensis]ROR31740.1 hypothetical protein EDD66_101358 [Mobilisporobacter senegalensis]
MDFLKYIEITPTTILLMVLPLLMMCIGVFTLLYNKKGNHKKDASKLDHFFYQLYFEFRKTPILKKYVLKMKRQLQIMSVFTKFEVYVKSAKYLALTATITTGTIIAALLLFDDIVSVLLCSAIAYMIPTTLIEKRISRINYIVYFQLKYAVESLRLEYMRCNNVVEALENVECGNRLVHIFDELHRVLVSANGELRLKEFYEITPFRPIQTLAQICYHINNTGDEVDKYGNSAFVESLLVMTSDINQELERLNYQRTKFGKIEYLCLIPIPCIKLVEMFLIKNMPGTVLIYKGPVGYVIHVAIILVSLITYTVVSRINNPVSLKTDDRIEVFKRMVRYKLIFKFMKNISPKNRKRFRLENKLRNAFSKKTVEELYLEKLTYALLGFVILITTFISSITIGRNFILNNVQSLSMLASDEMNAYEEEDILAMDNEYIANRDTGYIYEEEDLKTLIISTMPELTDLQISDQMKRLEDKYRFLKSLYFRWYFIPISFVFSMIGWVLPDQSIRTRMKELKEEEEEEFLQIQTLMIILMSMNCDTMEAIEYLSQLTRVHKEMFQYCYHSYAADPVKALENMEEKTPIPDFKRFINKLKLTIDELSLADAFSDLKMDREHICRERDVVLRDIIDRKRNKCGGLVKVGFIMVIMLLFMFPLLYLGFTEMMNGIKTLQGI